MILTNYYGPHPPDQRPVCPLTPSSLLQHTQPALELDSQTIPQQHCHFRQPSSVTAIYVSTYIIFSHRQYCYFRGFLFSIRACSHLQRVCRDISSHQALLTALRKFERLDYMFCIISCLQFFFPSGMTSNAEHSENGSSLSNILQVSQPLVNNNITSITLYRVH